MGYHSKGFQRSRCFSEKTPANSSYEADTIYLDKTDCTTIAQIWTPVVTYTLLQGPILSWPWVTDMGYVLLNSSTKVFKTFFKQTVYEKSYYFFTQNFFLALWPSYLTKHLEHFGSPRAIIVWNFNQFQLFVLKKVLNSKHCEINRGWSHELFMG